MKKYILLTLVLNLFGTGVFAYDFAAQNADGKTIYYNYINNGTELEVTDGGYYSGSVNIPESVTYMNRSRNVTSIGDEAFKNCPNLISVSVPKSVTSIGKYAFKGCRGLTSVTIYAPALSTYGSNAFDENASGRKIYVFNNWLSSYKAGWSNYSDDFLPITIGIDDINYILESNNDAKTAIVTSSPGCSGAKEIPAKVTYEDSDYDVTSIGEDAFYGCSGLTSVTIPNSVTRINSAFNGCTGLKSVHISDLEAWCKIDSLVSR